MRRGDGSSSAVFVNARARTRFRAGTLGKRIPFCHACEQASHGGELAGAVEAGLVGRGDVTELGAVLTGEAPGREHLDDVTLFDSTGLAIQDLAVAKAAFARADKLDLQTVDL